MGSQYGETQKSLSALGNYQKYLNNENNMLNNLGEGGREWGGDKLHTNNFVKVKFKKQIFFFFNLGSLLETA